MAEDLTKDLVKEEEEKGEDEVEKEDRVEEMEVLHADRIFLLMRQEYR